MCVTLVLFLKEIVAKQRHFCWLDSQSVSELPNFLLVISLLTVPKISHRIPVWYICSHVGYIDGKCYHI